MPMCFSFLVISSRSNLCSIMAASDSLNIAFYCRRIFAQSLSNSEIKRNCILHGENFMAIFTTLSVVIWFSTGTLGIFATLV